MMSNKIKILRYFFIVLSVFSTISLNAQEIGDTISSLPAPGNYPVGIFYSDNSLFHIDKNANSIYKIDIVSGHIEFEVPLPDQISAGDLTYFQDNFFILDSQNKKILQFNPYDTSSCFEIQLHTDMPSGITSDDQYIWYIDRQTKMIYQIDTYTSTYLDSAHIPGVEPTGVSWDGKRFWIADMRSNQLYLFDFDHQVVVQIVPLDFRLPQGISFDGINIWVCDLENKKLRKVALSGDKEYRILDSQRALLRYTVTIQNTGSVMMETKTYIACPKSSLTQILEDTLQFQNPPLEFFVDTYGQKIAYYYDNISAGSQRVYQYQVPAVTYSVRYFLNPDSVGTIEQVPDSILDLYTRDGDKYQINNSVIRQAALEAVGEDTNLYWQVRRIHDFVIDRIHYVNDSRWDAAPQVLEQGHGSCSEYSFLFIALCRSIGIPARYEAGSHLRDNLPYEDKVFHRWQQVYFPNYGWIPIDCTWDDRDDMIEQALYFGAKSKTTFTTTVGGGGERGMWWTYNSANSTSGGDMDREKKMEWLENTTSVEIVSTDSPQFMPDDFRLICNYPNPFNSTTKILFELKKAYPAEFEIYNLAGQLVWSGKKWCDPGENFVFWNGADKQGEAVSSGIYIFNLKIDYRNQSIPLLLIR